MIDRVHPVQQAVEITADPSLLKVIIRDMVKVLREGPLSRSRSLAVTKLEEARMWLDESLAVDGPIPEDPALRSRIGTQTPPASEVV